MGITINGSSAAGNIDLGTNGTIADLAVGGVPDGTIDADALASNAVTNVKVADDAIGVAELSATGTASSSTFLRGDNSWAAAGGGKLLQVQAGYFNTETSKNDSTWADTGITVDITPTSTDSHFVVHCHVNGIHVVGDDVNYAQFRLKGSGSGIDVEEWFGVQVGIIQNSSVEFARHMATASYSYYCTQQLNATSAVTFKVQWNGETADATSDAIYIGYGGGGAGKCSIVVMEIDD